MAQSERSCTRAKNRVAGPPEVRQFTEPYHDLPGAASSARSSRLSGRLQQPSWFGPFQVPLTESHPYRWIPLCHRRRGRGDFGIDCRVELAALPGRLSRTQPMNSEPDGDTAWRFGRHAGARLCVSNIELKENIELASPLSTLPFSQPAVVDPDESTTRPSATGTIGWGRVSCLRRG